MIKLLDKVGLQYFWDKLKAKFIWNPDDIVMNGFLKLTATGPEWTSLVGVFKFKGTVETKEDLPSEAEYGDVYIVKEENTEYVWAPGDPEKLTEDHWECLGPAALKYLPTVSDESETVEVGGISKGKKKTYFLDAEGKGKFDFSKMFDMLLFPTYLPQYKDPSCALTGVTTSNIFLWGTLPAAGGTCTKAKTYCGQGTAITREVYGGEGTITINRTVPSGSSVSGIGLAYADKIGSYKYTISTNFAKGTQAIEDSIGDPAPAYANNATTKIDETSKYIRTNLELISGTTDLYVIKELNNITGTAITYTAYNPIWIGLKSITPDMLTIGNVVSCNSSNGYITDLCESLGGGTGLDKNWYIDIPTGKNLWIKSKNVSGAYDVDVDIKLLETKDSEEWSGGQPGSHKITIDRYIYNGSGSKGADSYKIKIS